MRGDFLRRRKHAERINQKYRAFRVFKEFGEGRRINTKNTE